MMIATFSTKKKIYAYNAKTSHFWNQGQAYLTGVY